MGDERHGYDPNEDDRLIYGDEEQNPDEYYDDNQAEEERGYDYASAQPAAPLSARDRIAAQRQQRQQVRTSTSRLAGRDRNEQRRIFAAITVVCVLIILGGLAWLVINGKVTNNNTNSPIGYVAPTATIPNLGAANPTTPAGLPASVATAQVINGATPPISDTSPNVDATARPDQQPTLPPAVPTLAPGQPTALPPAVNTPPPGGNNPPPSGNNPASVQKYTVIGGDTMASIAAQFNVNVGQLMAANNDAIKNPSDLQSGQSLNIPSPDYSPPNVQWRVGPGESLYGIITALQATDTNPDKIAAANPCNPPNHGVCDGGGTIFPGDTITIPFH